MIVNNAKSVALTRFTSARIKLVSDWGSLKILMQIHDTPHIDLLALEKLNAKSLLDIFFRCHVARLSWR